MQIVCMKNTLLITLGILVILSSCAGSEQEEGDSVEAGFNLRPGEITQPIHVEESEEGEIEEELNEDSHHHHHGNPNAANEMLAGEEFVKLLSHYESEEREEWQKPDEVVAMLGEIEDKIVMDLGAGSGYFAFRLQQAGAHVIAAEVDDRFIQYLEEKRDSLEIPEQELDVRKVFFDDPLLNDDEVDVFFTVDTYHHIEDRIDYLKKVFKGVKPGGQLVVVDFKKEMSPHGPPANIRLHHQYSIDEVQKAGFSEVRVDTSILPEQYVLLALKPH